MTISSGILESGAVEKRGLFGGAMRAWIPRGFVDASDLRQISDHQEVFVDTQSDQSIILEILEMSEDDCEGGVAGNSAQFHFEELAVENDATGECSSIYAIESLNPAISLPGIQVRTIPHITPEQQYSYQHQLHAQLLIGRQSVSKFSSQSGDSSRQPVDIYLLCLRIPFLKTDILLTLNCPSLAEISQGSTANSAEQASDAASERLHNLRAGAARERGEEISATFESGATVVPANYLLEGEARVAVNTPGAFYRQSYFSQLLGNQNASSSARSAAQTVFCKVIESLEIVDWTLFGESLTTCSDASDIVNH